MFFKKLTIEPNTQDYVWVTGMSQHSIRIEKGSVKRIISGLFCPDINSKLMTPRQKKDLVKQLGLAYKRAGALQMKRENMPVDLSDLIKKEEESRESLKDETKKLLQSSYVDYLKSNVEETTLTEKKAYIFIFEPFYNEGDYEERQIILNERLLELKANMQTILDEGYAPEIISGTEIIQVLENNLNSLRGKYNRFISQSPEFILSDSQLSESELDEAIRKFIEQEEE